MVRVPTTVRRQCRSLRPLLAAAVAEAAVAVAAAQRRLRPDDVRTKGPGDFVTAVDLRTERALRRQLQRMLPDAGFLGEESAPVDLQHDWLWVVDPIDGTSNFSRQLPHFAVSVALLWRGQPVLACIHCAPEQALYTAMHGGGTHREGRRLRTPRGRIDAGGILGCQWFRGQQQLGFLARLQLRGARIRTFGSTVTQIADVACGRLDGNVQEQGRIWDLAAAGLVAAEAGARCTDWRGRPLFPFRDLTVGHTPSVIAPPGVHRALLRILAAEAPHSP